ncbi:MAG TPA: hypothetical protein VGC42_11525, partial [Kofleriaceae bacterium]
LLPALTGDEAAAIRERLERFAVSGTGAVQLGALTGLRYAGLLGPLETLAADREARGRVREHAIEQLGLAASAASEPVLAELLADDDDEDISAAARKALLKVLGGDRTKVSLYALGSRHEDLSGPAASYLATSGDPAALIARLGSLASADVRQMLREGLIRRGALPVPALSAALASAEPTPRAEVAWIAGHGGEAARALAPGLEASVARSAARLAPSGYAGRGGAVLGPAQLAELEAEWAGLWAARRLGRADGVEAVARGVLGAERAPVGLRREAASVLAVAGASDVLGALAAATGDVDREVRATAANALAARQPAAAAATVRALGSRADATTIAPLALAAWPSLVRELVREPATRSWSLAVSLIGRTVEELVAIATDKQAGDARLAAIAALGRLGGERATAVLRALHDDAAETDPVKLAAWKALKRILRAASKTYAEGQDKGPRGGDAAGATTDDDSADDDSDDDDSDDDDDDEEEDDDDE